MTAAHTSIDARSSATAASDESSRSQRSRYLSAKSTGESGRRYRQWTALIGLSKRFGDFDQIPDWSAFDRPGEMVPVALIRAI